MGNVETLIAEIVNNNRQYDLLPSRVGKTLEYRRGQKLSAILATQVPGLQFFANTFIDTTPGNGLARIVETYQKLGINAQIQGQENLPKNGCIIMANHPSGIPDTLVALYVLHTVNKTESPIYAVGASKNLLLDPNFSQRLIPINTRQRKGKKANEETLDQQIEKAKNEHAYTLVFPSGDYSHTDGKGNVQDGRWSRTRPKLAYKHKIPIVPMHINAIPNMEFYKHAHRGSIGRLRSTLMALEQLAGQTIPVYIGQAINLTTRLEEIIKEHKELKPKDWNAITSRLRRITQELGQKEQSDYNPKV